MQINEIDTIKPTQNINKINNWLIEMIHNIDKPLARLTNKQKKESNYQNQE